MFSPAIGREDDFSLRIDPFGEQVTLRYMKFLLAFDKYKGALSAEGAVAAAATAITRTRADAEIFEAPLTDGGEGFAPVIARALGGRQQKTTVTGPLFEPVEARYAMIPLARLDEAACRRLQLPDLPEDASVAFLEMASASGYEALREEQRDPFRTTSFGTGELLKQAAAQGASAIVLGIGGSATNDCGAGALEALGVLFYDRALQPVRNVVPAKFKQISSIGSTSHELTAFPPVRVACDVSNPLLGEQGATRIYGPQKGLRPEDSERLERSMRRMGTRILGLYGRDSARWEDFLAEPGTGAAGGIGFALRHALPDCHFVEGFALVADCLRLREKATEADVVFTGEGRLDESSLSGKGPVALLQLIPENKPVRFLAGSVQDTAGELLARQWSALDLRITEISDPEMPLPENMARTEEALGNNVTAILQDTH